MLTVQLRRTGVSDRAPRLNPGIGDVGRRSPAMPSSTSWSAAKSSSAAAPAPGRRGHHRRRRRADEAERVRAEEADRQLLRAEVSVLADDVVRLEPEIQLHPDACNDFDAASAGTGQRRPHWTTPTSQWIWFGSLGLWPRPGTRWTGHWRSSRVASLPAPPEDLQRPGGARRAGRDARRRPPAGLRWLPRRFRSVAGSGAPAACSPGFFSGRCCPADSGGGAPGGRRSSTKPTTVETVISAAVTSVAVIFGGGDFRLRLPGDLDDDAGWRLITALSSRWRPTLRHVKF